MSKAPLVTQAPENGHQDDVSRERHVIELSARSFVEAAVAGPTGIGLVTQRGLAFPVGHDGRATMRAGYGAIPQPG